ncbi:transporter substrate-binding domain-containing protein [Tepidibacter mesophilus]|uniref:transporter substrate-binding domain-containing protein n=1 Tax=Tepidibacter mesophilus TaxID=655607 RepID=UPI000C07CD05|nr:transporter substrate-binding domain-containing protein [Tepidibacter mesophilus]
MKRKIIVASLVMILLIIFFIESYMRIEYDINLYEYFKHSNQITKEEKEWLKKHGPIIYGADNNSPPLRYVDEESKQYQGLVIDYLRALSIELETEIKFEPLVWNKALESLQKSETDICDMYPSEERSKKYLLSNPIYYQRAVIVVPKNEKNIKNYIDLVGKKVTAQEGDYVIEFLSSKSGKIDYNLTRDYFEGMNLLKEEQVDAMVGDESVISYFMEVLNLKDDYKILDKPLYEKESVLAVPKSEKILLGILNKGIYNLKKKNTMIKIQQKWFGISTPIIKETTKERYGLIVLFFILIIFIASYLFFSWNKELKKEVDKRTKELYISRNDLEITFDGLSHFMIVLNNECRIVNVNKSFSNYINSNKENIIGTYCKDYPGILSMECGSCIIKKTFEEGKNYNMEFNYKKNIYEINTFHLVDDTNSIHRVLVMIRDITKIRISERQLLHSNKMSAVGQLAAGVAHEIRNPLGLIRSHCYVLKNNINDDIEKMGKSIKVMEKSVEKASNIIDNLLNFSRISNNNIENIDLRSIIDNMLELNLKKMEKQNINYKVECEYGLKIYFNEESLKHILINLISNAIDAMPNSGVLSISCLETDDSITILFSDTGHGIKKEDIENIFNPFFTTKCAGEGTGLGLFITYNEIKKFGGEIKVSSQIGQGTTFKIILPLRGVEENGQKQ